MPGPPCAEHNNRRCFAVNTYPKKVELVEVGPRDGFQSIKEFIPTELKKEIIDRLVAAGCTTVQVTSFVHPKAIPQMQDAKEVAQYVLEKYPALRAYALVPNLRGAQNAYEAGLREISYVISVSPGHNMANVRRTLEESFAELGTILATYPDMKVVLDAATAFGCPFDGEVTLQQVLAYVEKAHALGIRDIDLCDTIGVATPVQVENTILALREKFPDITFGVHIHDTRNMGMACSLVAMQCGIARVSTTVGGLGGCPFAPGASGNTASEDFVYMLEKMGVETGVDFEKLLQTAKYLREKVPGNYSGHQINIQKPQCTMG